MQRIAKIGTVGEGTLEGTENGNIAAEDDNDFKRFLPTEFLKRLPGIDSNNINKIIKNIRTMVDLSKLPEEELKIIIGAKNSRDLKVFLEKKVELVKDELDID